MKTKHLFFSVCLIAITITTKAQIKVFSGGRTTIGSTTDPNAIGVKHWIIGNKTAITATTSSVTSAPLIIGQNTFSSNPSYTWYNDEGTGFSHPSGQTIGFKIFGTEIARLTNNGNFLLGGTGDYGPKFIIYSNSQQTSFATWATHTTNYSYAQVSNVNNSTTKALSVVYNGTEKFWARGDGVVWCAGTYTGSDRNLKDNIDSIPNALNKILQLRGVTYNYKPEQLKNNAMIGTIISNDTPKKQMGLIAQEVELIVPEVVETMDNGLKGVAYQNLVGLLIEGIKEQNKKINQLEVDLSNCCQKKVAPSGSSYRGISPTENDNLENQNWLSQNKPNPFNKETIIEYNVVQEGTGSVLIFDMNGKLLKTITIKIPGKGSVTITANDLPAGMYYYTLVVNDNEVDTKKMILTQ